MKYVFWGLLLINCGYFVLQLQDVPVTDVVIQKRSANAGARIQLLAEVVSPREREAEMSDAVSNPMRFTDGEAQTCGAVGPFPDVFTGQDAVEQLVALDLSVDLKAVDVATGENDYRVLIPPASSAEESFRKLRELQASSIDSYVITQGPQALGISLGVFSTPEAAETLKNRVQAMGYQSDILEIARLSRAYWIFPATDVDLEIGIATWMANRPELEIKPMKCVKS